MSSRRTRVPFEVSTGRKEVTSEEVGVRNVSSSSSFQERLRSPTLSNNTEKISMLDFFEIHFCIHWDFIRFLFFLSVYDYRNNFLGGFDMHLKENVLNK